MQAKIYIYKTAKNAFSPPKYVTVTAYSASEASKRIIKEYQPDYLELTKVQNIKLNTTELDYVLNI